MKISFHGACREVTGSCILIETEKTKFLVDCGIFQGRDFAEQKNLEPFLFNPKEINFVLLTHAHLDHCGRLPKLYKEGFRGQIYCTAPTSDLARIMLSDSAKVIMYEARRKNIKPLYYQKDVNNLMGLFSSLSYNKPKKVNSEIKIRLQDAGHILGSTIYEVWVKEAGVEKKFVFSGDLGNPPAPLVCDPKFIDGADVVFVESTYGGRIHEPKKMRRAMLQEAIISSVGRGGTLMIPAFALERTQEVLYELNYLVENKKVPTVPVFIDSPLAIKATEVYKKYSKMFDKESRKLIDAGDDLFNFPGLIYTATSKQSKKINHTPPPKVILAGSGMCVGGRIPFHLERNLPNPKNHLLFISYQAEGSLGRKLFNGQKQVKIMGKQVKARAKVSAIGSYSSHGDQPQILHWVKMIKSPKPKKVFVVHGEEKSSLMMADGLRQKLKLEAIVPEYKKIYEI